MTALADFDLVLLDVMLPGLDGFEVCRRLRREHSTLPVLMLTARTSLPDRVRGLDLGADDYRPSRSRWRSCWPGSGR